MKKILVIALFVVSGFLVYFQFGIIKSSTAAECLSGKSIKKISPKKIIKMAEIYGISLVTPISEVNTLVGNAGYTCQENAAGNIWQCTHNKLRSKLNIATIDGQITTISRSGEASLKEMDAALNMADYLKSLSNTREGISVIQNPQMVMYSISFKKENRHLSALKYQITYVATSAGKDEVGGLLGIMIVR